jgi:hypothetical protein
VEPIPPDEPQVRGSIRNRRFPFPKVNVRDNIDEESLTGGKKNTDIEKIDSSFSDDDITALVEEALKPLFIKTDLSADQKAEIIYASSTHFKACIDSNNGLTNHDGRPSKSVEGTGGRPSATNAEMLALPSVALAIWKVDKLAGDTPPEFIKRVYGEWLGNGLTVADLRKLDPSLVRALAHHEKQGRLIPDGFDLPPGKRGPKIETGDSISPEVDDSQGVLRTYWRERQNQARAKRRDNEPDDGRGR